MKKNMKYDRKGFVLVLSLLTTTVLLALVIPYVSRVATDYGLTSRIHNLNAALNMAEVGIERAIWEIGYNSNSSPIPVSSFQASNGSNIGEYEVSISSDSSNAIITSHGYVPNKSSYKTKKTVMVTYSFHRAFGKGVAGMTGISMSGQADIDSYDSSKGAYDALLADGTRNVGQEGDIASNGPITITGQSKVYGSANPGDGYPFSGTPNVTGTYGTLQAPLTVDPIPEAVIAVALAVNNNSNIHKHVIISGVDTEVPYPLTNNALSVSSGEVCLSGGTYYFTSIGINGQIKVEGPSSIYVIGNIDIAGQGIVNPGGLPKDFLLYSTGSNVKIAGQGAFYGAVYAPTATVTYTGQADFYGSIVCGFNADKGQAALHYDKALANVMPTFVVNKVTSWQEIIEQ
jgi:hypothetical protein